MKSTSNIMVKSAGTKWKQIEAHVKRTQPYYSNKNVNLHRSGKNIDGYLVNYDKLVTHQFMPYIKSYNRKAHKQGNNSRMYGKPKRNKDGKYHFTINPIKDYLTRSRRRNERLVIFYLGNKDIRKKYYKILKNKYGLSIGKIRNIENKSLVDMAELWNLKNPYLKITDFATNTDETTAHIHTRLVVTNIYGKKRDMATAKEKHKGIHYFVRKPSMSFNKALVATYPHAVNQHGRVDNRVAMRQMRQRFDPIILEEFNNELTRNNIKLSLNLKRTDNVNHLSLKEYQAKKDTRQATSEATLTKASSAELSLSTSASYSQLAGSIESILPNLNDDNGEPITSESYLSIAHSSRHIGFHHNTLWKTGVDALSYATNESLINNKQSMIANYRSSAVNEAQPMISNAVLESTSNVKSSASKSANTSVNARISSVNSKIAFSNASWQLNLESSLQQSVSRSASDSVSAKSTALSSSSNSIAIIYGSYAKRLKNVITPYIRGRYGHKYDYFLTHANWMSYAKGDKYFHSGSLAIHDPLSVVSSIKISQANKAVSNYNYWTNSASSIRNKSSKASNEHFKARSLLVSNLLKYGNSSEDTTDKNQSLIYRHAETSMWSDSKLNHKFRMMMTRFVNNHKWAIKIAQKLHHYHIHLKKLFKRFLPKFSNQALTALARGTRYFKLHPKERQEDILFRMEDEHAQTLTRKSQKINQKIYNDNRNYHSINKSRPSFDLSNSSHWKAYSKLYYLQNGKYPNPYNKGYLNDFQTVVEDHIRNSEQEYNRQYLTPKNQIERSINNKVNADSNDASNYTHSWYVQGSDIPNGPDVPER